MYVQHFGLEHEAFSIAPDPRYLYLGERHREALAHLLYGLGGGGGFVLLTGEVGAGKTTVCRCFLEQVPPNCQVAYVFNPKLTVTELLAVVCEEFGIAVPATADGHPPTVKTYIDPLNQFLLAEHAAGRNGVLVIDEAQQLAPEVLEQLRLLTNLETNERKLLQIILIGQPELRELLAAPGLTQLAQRVIARYHLGPLDEADTARYLAHRLAVAGLRGPSPIGTALVRRIHRLSGGIPRRINLLCDRALLGAYSQGAAAVDRRTLDQAAREVFGPAPRGPVGAGLRLPVVLAPAWSRVLLGVVIGAIAAGAVFWAMERPRNGAAEPGSVSMAGGAAGPSRTASGPAQAGPTMALGKSAVAAAAGLQRAAVAASGAGAGSGTSASTGAGAGAVAGMASPSVSASASALQPGAAPASAARPGLNATPALKPDPVSTAAAPATLTLDQLRKRLAGQRLEEDEAWRQLAVAWGERLPAGDPCTAAARERLQCYHTRSGLLRLRAIDRPAMLVLRDGDGPPMHLVLVGLGAKQAWLQLGNERVAISLGDLANWWQGEFGTYWRSSAASPDSPAARNGYDAELARRLALADSSPTVPASAAELRSRLARFQISRGLMPDGSVGPLTQMLINQAAGIAEPRLAPAP
jgi:general secretion pathway protein A